MEVPCCSISSSGSAMISDVVVKKDNIAAIMKEQRAAEEEEAVSEDSDDRPKDLADDMVNFECTEENARSTVLERENFTAVENRQQTESIIKEQEGGGDHADCTAETIATMQKEQGGRAAAAPSASDSETLRDGITVVVVVDVHTTERNAAGGGDSSKFEKERANAAPIKRRIQNYTDSRMLGLDDITVVEDEIVPEKPANNNNPCGFLDLYEDDILLIEELCHKHYGQRATKSDICSIEKGVARVRTREEDNLGLKDDDITEVYNSKGSDVVLLAEYLDSNSNGSKQQPVAAGSFQSPEYFNRDSALNEANLSDLVNIGDISGVKKLLYAKKLDYNANVHGILASALKRGYADIAVEMLQHGATPVYYYETTGNDKLLHLAASLRDDMPLRMLLLSKYPAEWMLTLNERSETCLHVAAKSENVKLLDALLKHLLAYNQWKCRNLVDDDGLSLLHVFCTSQYTGLVAKLLDETQVPVDEAVPATSQFRPGYSALHFAASHYRYENVRLLIERGADSKAKTATGMSALHVVCKMDDLKWMLYDALPESLANLTVDELVQTTICNNLKSLSRHLDIINLLFENDCCVDARDKDGNSALMLLITSKYKLCLQQFLEEKRWLSSNLYAAMGYILHQHQLKSINRILNQYSYDPSLQLSRGEVFDLKNNAGYTCLHRVASERIVSNLTEMLLEEGARIRALSNDASTPLHLAAKNHSLEFIDAAYNFGKTSLDRMVDVNAQDDRGNTPLHYAYVKNATDLEDYRCFLLLLKLGTDVTIENESGSSVLSIVMDDLSKMTSGVLFPTIVAAFSDTVDNFKWQPDVSKYADFPLFAKRIEESKSELIFASQFWKLLTILRSCEFCNEPTFEAFVDELSSKMHVTEESVESKVKFVSACEFEVAELKRMRIHGLATMYNVLNQNMNRVAGYTRLGALRAILGSDKLEIGFPLYARMLRARYTRAVTRAGLLEKAMVSLKNLMGVDVPASCLYKITSYLTEKKLRDLVQISERFISESVPASDDSCEPCQKVARKS